MQRLEKKNLPGVNVGDIWDLRNDNLYFAEEVFSSSTTNVHADIPEALGKTMGIKLAEKVDFPSTVSPSASFILWLFISWKFHVTDGQNRSLIFRVKRMFISFPIFLLLLLPHPTSTYPISAYSTQHRYRIALFVLLNVYDATSDPFTFICLSKSQPKQIFHLTVPPP